MGRRAERPLAALLLSLTFLLAAGCAADPSAQYFPANPPVVSPPSSTSSITSASTVNPQNVMRVATGPVARPNPKLTPGAVGVTDLATICRQPKRTKSWYSPRNPLMSLTDQQTVFTAYNITPLNSPRYGLDLLIPLQLGGAVVPSNIWPVPTARIGVGFHEKQTLNARLHILVCHGEMPLAQAQHDIAADWVRLWIQYGG